MAKRHVIDYFNKVADQYHSMLLEIRDFEEECNKGLIEPERLDEVKKIIEPLKNNYMTWSYMMFLLNLPNRERKVKDYKRRNARLISNYKDTSLEDNNAALAKLNAKNSELKKL